ncbi:lasso peptide biosynthesis B2 protein [Halomonas nitroreducens]|uniref:Lasso peptide biosynthesis B2 protein n=1 Tax=Halomonas nitroreducens TaxID=447425 RepID=A0A431V530_9GAMM|nr:lasso peptide biosynthesis B2 protein [Halomonas nitroreducens]RTR05377.1 lasso peptide biosynthesis B2 protein [Halomonas nitroreducens]
MKTLRRFIDLPRSRQALVLEATCWLVLAWLLVRIFPFRSWSHWLGDQVPGMGEVASADAKSDALARDISRTITAINQRVGRRFTCLMLAMSLQWMLSRRHISSSLVLGAQTEQDVKQRLSLKAHAWVSIGSGVVLGEIGEQYAPLSSFVRRYRSPKG